MKTVGEVITYLSQFPTHWGLIVTRSDDGGYLIPYLEGEDPFGQFVDQICLTTYEISK